MRLSRPSQLPVFPFLALLISLMLLAGLAGCGSASSDNAPTLGPPASLGEPPSSQKNPPPRTNHFASAARSATASPFLLGSENGTGSVPGEGRVSGGDGPIVAPAQSTKPANPIDALVIPAWIAKDLASADVDTRIRALETWVLIAPVGSIDPLILAYENDEERVRGRAWELIQQDWARTVDRMQ